MPPPGEVFMVGTELDGRHCIRVALGSGQVQHRHVKAAWSIIQREAAARLQQQQAAPEAAATGR